MNTINDLWNQARSNKFGVKLDDDSSESVIYKGIKFVKDENGIRIYSTETDFYKDITKTFYKYDYYRGVNEFLKKKYILFLNRIEASIRNEVNTSKNHKRFQYLQSMRKHYLNKYNEINS
jgi:hypothetical protein